MGQQTHYFFALSLPNETKTALKDFRDGIKGDFPFSRWVHEQDFHITLAFLGQADKDRLESAKNLVKEYIGDTISFWLKIDHLGIFGRKEAPRIFWAGVQTEEKLHQVRNQVFSACNRAGFELEARAFSPHITLARKWQGESPFMIDKFETEKRLSTPFLFKAKKIVLYQTHLDRTPKYEAIASFPLVNDER
jgi:RNA 2',3'-cyclic 3'-phosphodiesterase